MAIRHRRFLAGSGLSLALTACSGAQPDPVSPVNAAEEVAREVGDADVYAPAETSPDPSEEKDPSDDSADPKPPDPKPPDPEPTNPSGK